MRFDAVLFDAGGVLLLPDSAVLGPLLAYYGGDPASVAHHRAHYAAMKAKSDVDAPETSWSDYDAAYVAYLGVDREDAQEAAEVLGRTRSAWIWREPISGARAALRRLADANVPIGVVSNANGQIAGVLARSICQVGPGAHVEVRCVVDSHEVGVAKPDPAIFRLALEGLGGVAPERAAFLDDFQGNVSAAESLGIRGLLVGDDDDAVIAGLDRLLAD